MLHYHFWYPRMVTIQRLSIINRLLYLWATGALVLSSGNDPEFLHYQCSVIPLYYKSIGVPYRYRSGTTAFTEQGAGHYTNDTIVWHRHQELNLRLNLRRVVWYPISLQRYWQGRQDSNLQPAGSKPVDLPIDLLPNCMVDRVGIEPTDNCLQSSQEPQLNHSPYYFKSFASTQVPPLKT